MRPFSGPGLGRPHSIPPIEHVQHHRVLRQLLAFAGRSIDDVVNCPIARREVILFHRLGRAVSRLSESVELEQQWNPLGCSSAPQSIHMK